MTTFIAQCAPAGVLRLLRVEAAGFSQVFDFEIQMGLQLAGCFRITVDVLPNHL